MFDWIIPALLLIGAAMCYASGTELCFRAAMTNDDDEMKRGVGTLAVATILGGIFIALIA